MFTTEVKRVINLIAEAVFPTDNVDENFNGHVMKLGKGDKFLTLYYDKDTKRPTAATNDLFSPTYDPNDKDNRIKFILKVYSNRQAPNGMDSIEADLQACYCPPHGEESKTIILNRHESIVPDVKFIEEMYMDDMEKVATFIVKSARRLINILQQRVESNRRYEQAINKK